MSFQWINSRIKIKRQEYYLKLAFIEIYSSLLNDSMLRSPRIYLIIHLPPILNQSETELRHEALYPLKNRTLFHQTSEHVHTFTEPQDLRGATQNGTEFMVSAVSTTIRHLTLRSSDIPHSGPRIYRNRRGIHRHGGLVAVRPACSWHCIVNSEVPSLQNTVGRNYTLSWRFVSLLFLCCTNFNLCNLNYTKLNNIAYKMQILHLLLHNNSDLYSISISRKSQFHIHKPSKVSWRLNCTHHIKVM